MCDTFVATPFNWFCPYIMYMKNHAALQQQLMDLYNSFT